jgi:hypothetical protein
MCATEKTRIFTPTLAKKNARRKYQSRIPKNDNRTQQGNNNKTQQKGNDKHQGSKKYLNTYNNMGTSMNTNKTQQRGHE